MDAGQAQMLVPGGVPFGANSCSLAIIHVTFGGDDELTRHLVEDLEKAGALE
jgi:hypothetical protein